VLRMVAVDGEKSSDRKEKCTCVVKDGKIIHKTDCSHIKEIARSEAIKMRFRIRQRGVLCR